MYSVCTFVHVYVYMCMYTVYTLYMVCQTEGADKYEELSDDDGEGELSEGGSGGGDSGEGGAGEGGEEGAGEGGEEGGGEIEVLPGHTMGRQTKKKKKKPKKRRILTDKERKSLIKREEVGNNQIFGNLPTNGV